MDAIERLRGFRSYEQSGEVVYYTYQNENEVPLYRLKEMLEIESSNKTSMEIALLLMNKIFEQLSPGNDDYPDFYSNCNAIDIITASMSRNIQCNCIMYSVVLSEALLSYGIKSKVVICRPYDFLSDTDCHCMVHAYIDGYKKWIAFDPAHNTVYRCDGKFLSIPELRECIIEQRKIIMFGVEKGKEGRVQSLLNSMAKYLVVFFCLEYNGFNCQSDNYENNLHVLLPINYKEMPKLVTKYSQTKITFYDKGFWLM